MGVKKEIVRNYYTPLFIANNGIERITDGGGKLVRKRKPPD